MRIRVGFVLLALLGLRPVWAASDSERLLDNFDDLSAWRVLASGQARLAMTSEDGPEGKVMRLDYDFSGGGGFVVVSKDVKLSLPEQYAFKFRLRGAAPVNHFEFKLVDPSGNNVWRYEKRSLEMPAEWREERLDSEQVFFAWGPEGGGPLHRAGAIEFVIGADTGGKGTVWLDDLRLEDRTYRTKPVVTASSALPGRSPHLAFDRAWNTAWRSAAPREAQWLTVDFLQLRRFGGLVIHWDPQDYATVFELQSSRDGFRWETAYTASTAAGPSSYLYLPDSGARYLRLSLRKSSRGRGYGIREIEIKPVDFARDLNGFFRSVARSYGLKGRYPRYLYGEQAYWTTVGSLDNATQALLNEDGLLEVDRGSFSIEPFLYVDGKLLTWADVSARQSLEQDELPIPSVTWTAGNLSLTVTAFMSNIGDRPAVFARYRLEQRGAVVRPVRLFLAVRPFQVTPFWQMHEGLGGITPIRELSFADGAVWVNRNKRVLTFTPARRFGAAAFDQGPVTDYLRDGDAPIGSEVIDAFGYASGALRYDLEISANQSGDVFIAVPVGTEDPGKTPIQDREVPQGLAGEALLEQAIQIWESALRHIRIVGPPPVMKLAEALRTEVGLILVNRDGPALQPGPRRYARAWIRDGAISATALLQTGFAGTVRDFLRWFVRYQTADGHFPCCVDRKGPDWLAEYDSNGQFIFAVMEYYRFTGDKEFLREMWPAVQLAASFMDGQRRQRMSAAWQGEDKKAYFGLLPESVSHEGYMAHPVHAYWDDFWALRGFRDAADTARILEDQGQIERLSAWRDEFRTHLYASLDATMARHGIPYLPGAVELGDFDPTASAVAVGVVGEMRNLPEEATRVTFDRFWEIFDQRRTHRDTSTNFSPYEIRIVEALTRLGQRQRALELLDYLLGAMRPPAWHQWTEIAWKNLRTPAFIGDMPHTWIGAEYIRAVRTLFVYEDEAEDALVLAAGLSGEWLENRGVAIKDLPTHYGKVSYGLRRSGENTLLLTLRGDFTRQPAKILLKPPLPGPIRSVTVNGHPTLAFGADEVTLGAAPAEVVIEYESRANRKPLAGASGSTALH
ncbi:MAG TPA: discoidin domain-containing protein [Methylococcaceae bacterium]|nr:discoidin domain-containing protein [Methylococcaceae bacterium]